MNDNYYKNSYPQRRNPRLPGYDYSQPGAYFITVCAYRWHSLFGQMVGNKMELNRFGEIVESVWRGISVSYPGINNEVFIVMPNHIHGIITINDDKRAGSKPAPAKKYPLSEIVRAFKSLSTRRINELRDSTGIPVWQRNYHERVIRDDSDYYRIEEYILYNPLKWDTDSENPATKSKDPLSS